MAQPSVVSSQPSQLLLEPVLVRIPAGEFWMGSEEGQEDERPVHRVWVDAFTLGKYPIT
ncbi:MAG: SUMF1/EgtB/PvdO family nonheme iron enzyme, partial [Candidatus Entotheonellia bacterium]